MDFASVRNPVASPLFIFLSVPYLTMVLFRSLSFVCVMWCGINVGIGRIPQNRKKPRHRLLLIEKIIILKGTSPHPPRKAKKKRKCLKRSATLYLKKKYLLYQITGVKKTY